MILGQWGELGTFGAAGDTTKPVITVDTTPITLEYGATFTPPVATASDNLDGDLSNQIVIDNPVDTNALGQYTVTYSGPTDSAGNVAAPVAVTVNVVDTTAPVITPDAPGDISISVGEAWPNPTATVTDSYDPERTIYSDTTTLDTSVPGSGIITFTATDSSGNEAAAVTQNYTVLADYSDVIETFAQVSNWEVIGDGRITAFKGRSNREVFKFRPSDADGIQVTLDGYIDFTAPYFDKLDIKMNNEVISTETDSVIIGSSPDEVCARLGDFNNLTDNASGTLTFIIYVGGDTRGTVIVSTAQASNNIRVSVSTV